MKHLRQLAAMAALIPTAALLASCGSDSGSSSVAGMTIQTLNNRPDLVSGGSALVRINVPRACLRRA